MKSLDFFIYIKNVCKRKSAEVKYLFIQNTVCNLESFSWGIVETKQKIFFYVMSEFYARFCYLKSRRKERHMPSF